MHMRRHRSLHALGGVDVFLTIYAADPKCKQAWRNADSYVSVDGAKKGVTGRDWESHHAGGKAKLRIEEVGGHMQNLLLCR